MVRVLPFLFALLLVQPATAQTGVSTLKCSFDVAVSPLKEMAYKANFSFTVVIDRGRNHAQIIGKAGVADLVMHSGNKAVSFFEMLPTGAAHTLTIYSVGGAVYSRQGIIGETPLPSQYIGECRQARVTAE